MEATNAVPATEPRSGRRPEPRRSPGTATVPHIAAARESPLSRGSRPGKLFTVSRPVAGEPSFRIPTTLTLHEFRELRVTRQQLIAKRMAMIGQKIAAPLLDRTVNEPAEVLTGSCQVDWIVIHVQVENDAGVVLLGPLQERVPIALDETNRSVDEIHLMRPKVLAHGGHELHETVTRHIQLGDHLRARYAGPQMSVEHSMVVVQVDIELMRVVPINLAAGPQVEVGKFPECLTLVHVCEIEQATPVRLRQSDLTLRDGRLVSDGPVA